MHPFSLCINLLKTQIILVIPFFNFFNILPHWLRISQPFYLLLNIFHIIVQNIIEEVVIMSHLNNNKKVKNHNLYNANNSDEIKGSVADRDWPYAPDDPGKKPDKNKRKDTLL